MYIKRTCLALLCLLLPALPASAAASIAINGPEATANYWIAQQSQGDTPLLSPGEISNVNRQIRQRTSTLQNLADAPVTLSSRQVTNKITAAAQDFNTSSVPAEYVGSNLLNRTQWQKAWQNCALEAMPASIPIRYAVTTARTDLRLLPVAEGWYHSPNDIHYDDLQGSALDPAEAVVVLSISQDKKFAFVETRSYHGWTTLQNLAFTDRKTWLSYLQPKKFIVVTDHKQTLTTDHQPLLFQMGAVIPYTKKKQGNYTLALPKRNSDGSLKITGLDIRPDETLHDGFLPFTRNTLIRQAFRFLGDEYGWGGQDDSVDCSAFVQDVYRSMGLEIPRDADQQELALPSITSLAGLSTKNRYAAAAISHTGALFFKPGHVMMYLGQDTQNRPIVIHCASSYFTFNAGQPQKYYIRKVLVSDLTYQNHAGTQTIDSMTHIGQIR